MEQTIERTAYHEAAHAVIAWFHRRGVNGISIKPEGESLGRLSSYPFYQFPETSIHDIEIDLDIIFAGRAAEEIKFEHSTNGWFGDYLKALDAVEAFCKKIDNAEYLEDINRYKEVSGDDDYFMQLADGGENLFCDYGGHVLELLERDHIWACVDHVAKILIERHEIDGPELNKIISDIWELEKVEEKEEKLDSEREAKKLGREWGVWGDELKKAV